jgi:Flp pilus assembly protein TadG
MLRRTPRPRSGAAALEFAIVSPVLMLFLFGLVVGGLGIFRYHQVASLAREASRYASVHGLDYERETGQPAATEESISRDIVRANAAGLDPNKLTCSVTWDQSNLPKQFLPDKTVRTNVVIVTVSYRWLPEAYFGGITLTSTSKLPMSF